MLSQIFAKISTHFKYVIFLVAICLGSFYIIVHPGPLEADAFQYHELSVNLLHGDGFSLDGAPNMDREPLYPAFRALLLFLGLGLHGILWAQLFLVVAALFLFMRTIEKSGRSHALIAGSFSALYPGFMVWPSLHLSESVAIFFIASIGYVFTSVLSDSVHGRSKWFFTALAGVLTGGLILTKAAYLFLPFILIAAFFSRKMRRPVLRSLVFAVAVSLTVFPWLYRNHQNFGGWKLTNRSGWMVYARGIKSEYSWAQLMQTGVSVVVGESIVATLRPDVYPIIRQQWVEPLQTVIRWREEGISFEEIDHVFMERGKNILLRSPVSLIKYAAWIPIEAMRLFGITSFVSPLFNIEQMFIVQARAGTISLLQLAIVGLLHFWQLIWVFSILMGAVILFRRGRAYHVEVIFFFYTGVIYSLFDAIARYSAPVFPYLVVLAVTFWMYLFTKYGRLLGSGRGRLIGAFRNLCKAKEIS